MAHLPQMRIFSEKPLIISITYCPLSLCKIKKKQLRADQSYKKYTVFRPKMAHLPKMRIFSEKPFQPLLLCEISKKSLDQFKVKRMHCFYTQNGPFATYENFFRKPLI